MTIYSTAKRKYWWITGCYRKTYLYIESHYSSQYCISKAWSFTELWTDVEKLRL